MIRQGSRLLFGESPDSEETGDLPLKYLEFHTQSGSWRLVGKFYSSAVKHNLSGSNWHRHCRSGSFTRLSSSTTHQARVCLPALPGCRSGGFTRLLSSTTHLARVCPGPSPVRRADTSDRSSGFCSRIVNFRTKERIGRRPCRLSAGIQTACRRCPRYRRPGCPWPPGGRRDHCGAGADRSSFSPRNRRS